jgi:hypothetical protein
VAAGCETGMYTMGNADCRTAQLAGSPKFQIDWSALVKSCVQVVRDT